MTSRDFCYWLQGFLELHAANGITDSKLVLMPAQVQCIERHLNLVFKHEIDPSFGGPEKQAPLDKIHQGVNPFDSHVKIRC